MTKTSNESPQPTTRLVHTSAYFRVEPCVTCFIPGYLIVTPKLPTASLSELERGALASLGPTLAAATRAIEVVVRPERVYCALFAEETRSIHFHLFSPNGVASIAVCRHASCRSRNFRSTVAGLGSPHIPSSDFDRLHRDC